MLTDVFHGCNGILLVAGCSVHDLQLSLSWKVGLYLEGTTKGPEFWNRRFRTRLYLSSRKIMILALGDSYYALHRANQKIQLHAVVFRRAICSPGSPDFIFIRRQAPDSFPCGMMPWSLYGIGWGEPPLCAHLLGRFRTRRWQQGDIWSAILSAGIHNVQRRTQRLVHRDARIHAFVAAGPLSVFVRLFAAHGSDPWTGSMSTSRTICTCYVGNAL